MALLTSRFWFGNPFIGVDHHLGLAARERTAVARTVRRTAGFSGSLDRTVTVCEYSRVFRPSGRRPIKMLTSISPSPPAGMSFLDRRTGVQPHPEPTRSMMSVAEPALWKLKRHDCSLFSGTSPKSCSSRSNWIEGFPKKKAVDNNAPARTTADRFIALPLYFGCIGEHTRMLASRTSFCPFRIRKRRRISYRSPSPSARRASSRPMSCACRYSSG